MEDVKVFKYAKCTCCSKNHKISTLIELNSTNSLEVADESLNFLDLLLDCCLLKFDDDKVRYICEGCKEQLIMFHMFKRDVKKYNSFAENVKKLEVLVKIDELLSNLDDIEDLSVYQHDKTILITKNVDDFEQEVLQTEQVGIVEDETMIEQVPLKCSIEEEYIDEEIAEDISLRPSVKTEDIQSDYSYRDEHNDSYNSSEGAPQAKRRKKYIYKVNTNDSLTPDQLTWLKQQVGKSSIVMNGKKVYQCSLCGTILQIPGSLKKHLRDSHLLKSKDEADERELKRQFKDEIANSRIEVETGHDATEFLWKCQRCTEDRIFRSESGLKVHLRYFHIKSQVIDADFVASCRISVNEDGQIKNAWQCPECSKILKSRDGLRNHMKLEHPDYVENIQSLSSVKHEFEKNVKPENTKISLQSVSSSESILKLPTINSSNSICEPCGLLFINGSTKRDKSLEIHNQLHIILKTVSQSYDLPKCEQCKVMFSSNEDLTNHLVSHDPDEIFTAEGLSLLVAKTFKEPTSTAGSDDIGNWKCGHCDNVRFAEEVECIEHQMLIHSKQMICPIDYLEFNGIRGLSQFCTHMKNKHPEMFPDLTISCSYCQKEFSNVFDKLTHMKNCDSKEFGCDHCTKKFFTKTQLLRHLKIVSGVISFTCDVCSKKCVSAMDLKLHYRSHTNEKTYQCTFPNCQKVFKTPGARSSHMEIHSFVEYECSDCKAIFKQRALLQRHLKNGKCKGAQSTAILT